MSVFVEASISERPGQAGKHVHSSFSELLHLIKCKILTTSKQFSPRAQPSTVVKFQRILEGDTRCVLGKEPLHSEPSHS